MRFIIGMAVLFGVMLVMVIAWVLFWDRPNLATSICTVAIAYFIGYAIDKTLIQPEQNKVDNKQ